MDKEIIMDQMTPLERERAWQKKEPLDRWPVIPFSGEFKCLHGRISPFEFWHEESKMVEAELAAFYRYGYDRIVIGPNTRGIMEALGGRCIYPKEGAPYMKEPVLKTTENLVAIRQAQKEAIKTMTPFFKAMASLEKQVGHLVPLEASIGGPFTIAAQLRGTEQLLRDTRKSSTFVKELLYLIVETQKQVIQTVASFGAGIAMADPVASPALIGPRMYEEFVFPFTMELTNYAYQMTGKKVSLHMCGQTKSIWPYIAQYPLNEISLDNVVNLEEAAKILGAKVPIAGNIDPVAVIYEGTSEEIYQAVGESIVAGAQSACGYRIATGCDIPERTDPHKVDILMKSVRQWGYFRKN